MMGLYLAAVPPLSQEGQRKRLQQHRRQTPPEPSPPLVLVSSVAAVHAGLGAVLDPLLADCGGTPPAQLPLYLFKLRLAFLPAMPNILSSPFSL